jgi:hypothetical protein
VSVFVSAWQQNNQSNRNKKPSRENQEDKRQPSRARRQGCQRQRSQAHKNGHSAKLGRVAHQFTFYAQSIFAPSLGIIQSFQKLGTGDLVFAVSSPQVTIRSC